jgi:UDP-N-acetylmuramyl pentapeptide phosphotransferase/UDP-N-acetylglucosamine-1-phosphate transferase
LVIAVFHLAGVASLLGLLVYNYQHQTVSNT